MKLFSKKFSYAFLFLSISSLYAAEVHNLSEGSRIQANICPTEMNRISVQGDRIAQVFGAEGKFTHQVDEETGQFFLKPLSQAEGGFPYVPVSLTLITESGLTQDMTLFPREKTAATILLKPSGLNSKENHASLPSFEGLGRALPYQEVLLGAFRVLANEVGTREEGKSEETREERENLETPSQRTNFEGITAYFIRQIKGPQYVGQVFEITNSSSELITVQEKQFFQTHDLALALTKTTLAPQEKAKLYVIRKG